MKFSVLLSHSIILIFVATVADCGKKADSEVDVKLFRLIYTHNGIPYYLSSKSNVIQATQESFDPTYDQFVFERSDATRIRGFQTYADVYSREHFYIGKEGSLSFGNGYDYDYGSTFQLKSIGGESEQKFKILFFNEALVTPSPAAPFKFYTSSRYPTEPPAEFIFEKMSLNEAYAGRLGHTLPILKLIQKGGFGNKTEAYENLLNIVPHTGKDIFDVSYYIKEDLGTSSSPFLRLPSQVQLVVSGEPLELNCTIAIGTGYSFPMKYNYTSSPLDNIKPYTFSYSNGLWAITYANSHQLSVSDKTPYNLIERSSGTQYFEFQLIMRDDGEFGIYSRWQGGNTFYSLEFSTSLMPYYFKKGNGMQTIKFTVQKYPQP